MPSQGGHQTLCPAPSEPGLLGLMTLARDQEPAVLHPLSLVEGEVPEASQASF